MTPNPSLTELAERVEKASGHDCELPKDIFRALNADPGTVPVGQYGWREDESGWWLATGEDGRIPPKRIDPPKWLISIDSAMTLVDWAWLEEWGYYFTLEQEWDGTKRWTARADQRGDECGHGDTILATALTKENAVAAFGLKSLAMKEQDDG